MEGIIFYLLIGIASFILTLIGTITSGTGIVMYSILIFLGYPPHIAIASFRFGLMGAFIGTLPNFLKHKKIAWEFVKPIFFISILAAIIGTNIFLSLNEDILSLIIGIAILSLLPILYFNKKIGIIKKKLTEKEARRAHLLMFLQQIWANVFPPGAGLLGNFILMKFYKLKAVEAKATNKIPQIFSNLIGVIMLAFVSLIDYKLGFVLLISNLFGAHVGTHIMIKKGDLWVKNLIMVFMVLISIKLIFF